MSSHIIALVLFAGTVYADVQFHRRLVKDLVDFSGYDQRVRPVRNNTKPVSVRHRMNLYQILEVNEPKQKLVLYVWITQFWTDEYLGWDPSEYGGIKKVVLPWHTVWLPDTYLYNSLEMTREATERWISVQYSTRRVTGKFENQTTWVADSQMQFPAIYQSTCKMNIRHFPFDWQNCSLTIGSWTFDSGGIDYWPERLNVGFESFVANEEWRVLSFDYYRESIKYECCPHPWVLLHVRLVIQRKPLYYIVNLIFPTAIITFIAVVGFFMPATTSGERVEKVNLGITTLLAMSILLLMVTDQMPTTSDYISIMGWFFLAIIILISAGTVLTSIIILLNQQGNYGRPLPRCLAELTRKLGPCMFVKPPPDLIWDNLGQSSPRSPPNAPRESRSSSGLNTLQISSPKDDLRALTEGLYPVGKTQPPQPGYYIGGRSPMDMLESINEATHSFADYLNKQENKVSASAEWDYACDVLDRICLCTFSLAVGGITLGLLFFGLVVEYPESRWTA